MAEALLKIATQGRDVEVFLDTRETDAGEPLKILPRFIEHRKGYHFLKGIQHPGENESNIRLDRVATPGGLE